MNLKLFIEITIRKGFHLGISTCIVPGQALTESVFTLGMPSHGDHFPGIPYTDLLTSRKAWTGLQCVGQRVVKHR